MEDHNARFRAHFHREAWGLKKSQTPGEKTSGAKGSFKGMACMKTTACIQNLLPQHSRELCNGNA